MKQDFIYLDWNVFKDLIDDNFSDFYKIMDTLKGQYRVPFSFAHLCDRQKNISTETLPLIKKDLEFVNNFSDGFMIGRLGNDYGIAKQNIFLKFNEVSSARQNDYPQFDIPNEIILTLIKEGAISFFKNKKNIEWYVPLFYTAMSRFNCNHEFYLAFREVFKLNPPEPELQFFWNLQNPNITSNDLLLIVDNALAFEGNNNPKLYEQLKIAYLYFDFNPTYREKVNKKTNFTNMYTDCEHMLNASHSKYYITKDKNTIKRTKFVFETYSLKTEVFDIEGFIEFVKNGFSA